MARSKKATEFGGVPGLTQPAPAPLTAAEQMRLERASNSSSIVEGGYVDSPEAALIRELERERRL